MFPAHRAARQSWALEASMKGDRIENGGATFGETEKPQVPSSVTHPVENFESLSYLVLSVKIVHLERKKAEVIKAIRLTIRYLYC